MIFVAHTISQILTSVSGNLFTEYLHGIQYITRVPHDVGSLLVVVGVLTVVSVATVGLARTIKQTSGRQLRPEMPSRFDVFISSSPRDEKLAEEACKELEGLEGKGLVCWLVSRDYDRTRSGEQVANAVRSSQVVLAIYTRTTSDFSRVSADLWHARRFGVRVISVTYGTAPPPAELKRYLRGVPPFDAQAEPLSVLVPQIRSQALERGIVVASASRTSRVVAPARIRKRRWQVSGAVRSTWRRWSAIRTGRQIQEVLGLPLLAEIPLVPPPSVTTAVAMMTRDVERDSYVELMMAMISSALWPLRLVTITSSREGDGTSTVAINIAAAIGGLAIANSERHGRVLLIDANLRRPSLHDKLNTANKLGLSDILIGRVGLRECVQHTELPGVDVLTSGTHSPNPIKLLQSERLNVLLHDAGECYKTVVVDTPALAPHIDAAIIATNTDSIVMVLSTGQTDMPSARKALARLGAVGNSKLLGAVLNRSTSKAHDYINYIGATSIGTTSVASSGTAP